MTATLEELTPQQVHDAMRQGHIVLIDVREPQEYASEHIHGALLFPLSTFDPAALPAADSRPIVFQCGSGKRSAMAVARCQAAGVDVSRHLKGGIMAWKQAGLPTASLDPATGAVVDRR
jgi:rhodanese-related sulfurtransferase